MEEKTITLNGKTARYYTINNPTATKTVHFYGGNGFAVGVYEPLLQALAKSFNVIALALRGEWIDKPTDDTVSRETDANSLIEFLQKTQDKPVIGIGHSQGATATAIACAKRPDLFVRLVLLEPVTFTKEQVDMYEQTPKSVKMTQELFQSTLTKQANWQSVTDYYTFLRSHKAYKRIDDDNLQIYANNSLEKLADGTLTLRFPPEQELANYFGTPFIMDALQKVIQANLVPVHLVIGKPSMFISEAVRAVWATFVPAHDITVLPDYGHLLPLENPQVCADIVKKLSINN